jgi:hypothetical protein
MPIQEKFFYLRGLLDGYKLALQSGLSIFKQPPDKRSVRKREMGVGAVGCRNVY